MKRWFSLHTTTSGCLPGIPPSRSTVDWNSVVLVSTSGRNCLGRSLRDTGHNREPEPPDSTTGTMGVDILYLKYSSKVDYSLLGKHLPMVDIVKDVPGSKEFNLGIRP